jgi:hypothetical protein
VKGEMEIASVSRTSEFLAIPDALRIGDELFLSPTTWRLGETCGKTDPAGRPAVKAY